MKRFMKKRKMRGFTLVELLIVIIIIGILAGALLLVAGAGTDKANATKIVSDMRGLKAASIMVYADYSDWPGDASLESMDSYMDRDLAASSKLATYTVEISGDTGVYIQADISAADDGVKDKLVLMADESGLYNSTSTVAYNGTGDLVWMKVK